MLPISHDFILDALFLASFANNADTIQLLASVLEIYNETKEKHPTTIDEEFDVFFDIIRDIVEVGVDLNKKAEISRIVLKVKKSSLGKRNNTFVEQVTNILQSNEEVSDTRISSIVNKIQTWVIMSKTTSMLRRMLGKCNNYNPLNNAQNDLVLTEIADYARDLTTMQENMYTGSATIDMVDFSNPKSISKAINLYQTKRDNNVFPTGLAALNRMLGPSGGFLRGESWMFAASSHNFKTGMLMLCANWCCTRSTVTVPSGMTPCCILISLENEVPENTMEMIRVAYVTAYKKAPPKNISNDELIEVVQQHYNKKGIKFLMYRFDEQFGYKDYVKLITSLEHKGLCVVAAILDYMGLINIDERGTNRNYAQQIQATFKQFCNFNKRKDILFITGWQLGTEADMINSSGVTNVVRRYGPSCLGDCRGVRREVDGLIFMYIEKNQDEVPYLTVAWNKHRDTTPPKKEDSHAAWRFAGETLGIMDDVDTGVDSNVINIYADVNYNTEENELASSDIFKSLVVG